MNIIPIHLFYKSDHEFELYNTNICKGHLEIYEKQKTIYILQVESILKKVDYIIQNKQKKNWKRFLKK